MVVASMRQPLVAQVAVPGEFQQRWFYQESGGPEQLHTLYSLVAQLRLEGHRNVSVSYHETKPVEGPNSLERFTLTMQREKYWQTVGKKSGENTGTTSWGNVGRFAKLTEIPNKFVKIVWEMRLEAIGGVAVLVFHRPILAWAQTHTFEAGTFFRIM